MPGPARAGAFIYAKDLERIASFYEALVGLRRLDASAERIVLESPDLQLVVHAMPPGIAATVTVATPPERRQKSAVKLFFSVGSLASAAPLAARLGGEVFAERWPGPGFTAANACDPEGNVMQLREWPA